MYSITGGFTSSYGPNLVFVFLVISPCFECIKDKTKNLIFFYCYLLVADMVYDKPFQSNSDEGHIDVTKLKEVVDRLGNFSIYIIFIYNTHHFLLLKFKI